MASQAIIANQRSLGGGGSRKLINVAYGVELPATVVNDQVFIITDTAPTNIYFDTNEPENPVAGDIWVQIAKSARSIALAATSPYCDIGINQVKQYSGNDWVFIAGCIGENGEWKSLKTYPSAGTPLSEWDWEEIVSVANSGEDVRTYFAVGDEKEILLTNGGTAIAVIGDFYHNEITGSNGKKAALAFTIKNCLNDNKAMNSGQTNEGGWGGSDARKTHIVAVTNTFPAELLKTDAIKYVDVLTTAGNKSTAIVSTSDRLRLHSVTELGFQYANAGNEGTVYAYYTAGNRIKKRQDGIEVNYWTRSPRIDSPSAFCSVDRTGAVGGDVANNTMPYSIAFDI